jgi:1,4-dihydroxy-2-naphthoate octaprenyltransferase
MIVIPTWSEVLTKIPRLEATDWHAMSLIKRWFVATRSAVFIMTLFSAVIGILMALPSGQFDAVNAILVAFGLVMAHATNNLVNDWTDHKKGVDKDNYFRTQYGPQPIEDGLITESTLFRYIAVTGGIALLIGFALVFRTDINTFYLMLVGVFFVLFYTYPLKFIGLGEPAVWLVWGPLMVCGSAYVVSGQWSSSVFWLSLLYGLGPTTVLFGKHTDKLKEDEKKGVNTLPVILGEQMSRFAVLMIWQVQYLGITIAVLLGLISWPFLIVWLALPKALKNVKYFLEARPEEKPDFLPDNIWPLYLVAFAFDHNRAFSGLLFLAVIANLFI